MEAPSEAKVTKRDLWSLFFRSFFLQSGFSFERMQALGLTWMFMPLIKKFYPKKEDRAEALKRHLVFYNTNPWTGSILTGMIAAMEEKNAKGELGDGASINSLKGSLIGPLAGIGDSLFLLIFAALLGVAADFSMQGSPVGVILLTVIVAIVFYGGVYLGVTRGYSRGEAFLEQLTGKSSGVFLSALGMIGALVIGALVGTWVNISTPLGEGLFQQTLDGILPKMLPLGFTVLAFSLLKKGWSAVWVMLLLLAIGIVGGHLGILASSVP